MSESSVGRKKLGPVGIILALSAAFFVVFMIVSGILVARHAGKSSSKGASMFGAVHTAGVGVIELGGIILKSTKMVEQIREMSKDPAVKSLVVRINSPGGAVAPSQEIYQALKQFGKPVVASLASVAASGGYYVACGANKIFSNPGSLTGSIGVIMEFADLRELYQWAKVKRFSIKSGAFKAMGSTYEEMTPDERKLLQRMVDDVLVQFKDAVKNGRRLTQAEVDAVADGRIFSGKQAKDLKLVDELGSFRDAIRVAASMGGVSGDPQLIYPEKEEPKLLHLLFGGGGGDDEEDFDSRSRIPELLGKLLGFDTHAHTPVPAGVYWLWQGAL